MSIRSELIAVLENPNYSGKDVIGLAKALNVSTKDLEPVIEALINEGLIFLSKKGDYFMSSRYGLAVAKITRMLNDFAIAQYNDDDGNNKEIKIRSNELKDALCYDTILLSFFDDNNGSVFRVIKHENSTIVGEYHHGPKDYVTPDDINLPYQIIIKKEDSLNAVEGHKVVVEPSFNKYDITGKIIKILGHKNDPGVDIMSQVYVHKVPFEFPVDVLSEAQNKPSKIDPKDIEGRYDFRSHLICTIDGKDAKDLDDAVEVKILDNGNYELGVHIADVSHYVTKGSIIDKEAFQRGTSVYMVDSVIPMLPHVLSNGICSLNPNEDRLTMSCVMEINQEGKVVNYKIGPSVIRSTYRLNYDDVNSFYKGEFHFDKPLEEMLLKMRDLSNILSQMKIKRGALDLDAPEAKILVDEKGKVKDIQLKTTGVGEKVIEDFMIAANETTATHVTNLHLPYIYRVHDVPKPEKIASFALAIEPLGYHLKIDKNNVNPKDLQHLLNKVKGDEKGTIISTMMLRSFAKAVYDSVNIGHFGIASKCYSHFTSPIRRYPDLLAHRLQKLYASNAHYNKDDLLEEVTYIAMQCSIFERRAVELERAVDDMKKAEYMG
ncbi:MAG: ribonuclease R, partial [Bacilli bacterium]|nr:ribonuclease R [Bacilli bacterium]